MIKCQVIILVYTCTHCFSLIVKPSNFAYVNHTRISSWIKPVLSNEV